MHTQVTAFKFVHVALENQNHFHDTRSVYVGASSPQSCLYTYTRTYVKKKKRDNHTYVKKKDMDTLKKVKRAALE